jgi:glc operon protein GlcG
MSAPASTNVRQISAITAEGALHALRVGADECQKAGVRVSITVVDPTLTLIAFLKIDGAAPHSVETSRRKAQTSASTGRASGWMSADLALTLPLGTNNLLTNIPGGVPLKFDGTLVGGIGIAGGTVEQDAAVAQAIMTALGADPLPHIDRTNA